MAKNPPSDAVAAAAESRGGQSTTPPNADIGPPEEGEGYVYEISERLLREHLTKVYEWQRGDPVYRPLKIFFDPSLSRLAGGIASTKVPYEPLPEPGPVGSVVEVVNSGPDEKWGQARLDDPKVLMTGGYVPSLSDPKFHQQMTYAVAMMTYDSFKAALGRNVSWPFERTSESGKPEQIRLRLAPHGREEANAWYDPVEGEITFGYFRARVTTAVAQAKQGFVYTAASHDVIAHEMSHALLDGLRAKFLVPSHVDVLAFHEAFADLVACFQHFTFEDTVAAALRKSKDNLAAASVLVELAQDFGRGLGAEGGGALRTLVDAAEELGTDNRDRHPGERPRILTYEASDKAPHKLGRVLARAVFAAFQTIFERRIGRYKRLATGGSGILPLGDISSDLLAILVGELRSLAGHFLNICIRAIDYCPPVDVRFGDYLQALITADRDIIREDDLAYREAIIRAFAERGIFGEGTKTMTEDALAWNGPSREIRVPRLSFGEMKFDGDPGRPASPKEMRAQAGALGRLAVQREVAEEFGLVSPDSPGFVEGKYGLPVIESVRPARRIGPDRSIAFDTVAEIIQERTVLDYQGRPLAFLGGATVILGPDGVVRYIVRKRVNHERRLGEQLAYMDGDEGAGLWEMHDGVREPSSRLTIKMCVHAHDE